MPTRLYPTILGVMLLTRLKACNFRSLKRVTLRFDRLAVLIGENDAGKSSTLDLLEMLLGSRRPDINDYSCRDKSVPQHDGTIAVVPYRSSKIIAIADFRVIDSQTDIQQFANDGLITLRKRWTLETADIDYWGSEIANAKLAQDFTKLKKADLDQLIQELDPNAVQSLKNNDEKARWLVERTKSERRVEKWVRAPKALLDALPRFERFRAIDYANPNSLMLKTLRQVYEQIIYEEVEENGQKVKRLDKRLSQVQTEATDKIRSKIQELKEFVRRYAPQVTEISYDPVIDFGGGLREGELLIGDGRGLHYFSKLGDGTKRRVFMATTEWDRATTLQQISAGDYAPPVIRGYDEPDTNLHYEAQRKMYGAISDIAGAPNSNIQMIVCTHSLAMIDRAPAKSINLLRLNGCCATVERLNTDDDPEVEQFLTILAGEMGITNTVMFYERCFVLIEGETEANALPLLYRAAHGKSLLEDGVRLISVQGNGATKEFLRLLSRNRQEMTVVFVDRDTETEDQGRRAKLTRDTLKQAGFSDEFVAERIVYVGGKEFEDAFTDDVLTATLNHAYPKTDGPWTSAFVADLRTNKKLSDALGKAVHEAPSDSLLRWGKPEFGKSIGRVCQSRDMIPQEVLDLFDLVRRVAGCTE